MIKYETDRMIMIAENLSVVDGKIKFASEERTNKNISLESLEPITGESFNFYDKNNIKQKICYIAVVYRDDQYVVEIKYFTEVGMRRKGYMTEALNSFVKWFFANIKEDKIYALIVNNPGSQRILERTGFKNHSLDRNMGVWFVLEKKDLY